MTPDERRAYLESVVDGPCPKNANGHGDPDNSGQCIYCGCIIDIMDDDIE